MICKMIMEETYKLKYISYNNPVFADHVVTTIESNLILSAEQIHELRWLIINICRGKNLPFHESRVSISTTNLTMYIKGPRGPILEALKQNRQKRKLQEKANQDPQS